VNVMLGELNTVSHRLNGDRFDCILLLNILHLLPDPAFTLASFARLLTPDGRIVIGSPNFSYLPYVCRRVCRDPRFVNLGSYENSGLHVTTRRVVRRWFDECRLTTEKVVNVVPDRWRRLKAISGSATDFLFGRELIVVGRRVR
ncbi:MAG: methyltransferase domain-containing protein, partial [Acidobacteriota bacterium]